MKGQVFLQNVNIWKEIIFPPVEAQKLLLQVSKLIRKNCLNILKTQLFQITYFVLQVKGEPSSSSSHVVLQRLQARRQGEETELPRIGEEDIDNVIGSREYSARHVTETCSNVTETCSSATEASSRFTETCSASLSYVTGHIGILQLPLNMFHVTGTCSNVNETCSSVTDAYASEIMKPDPVKIQLNTRKWLSDSGTFFRDTRRWRSDSGTCLNETR